MGDGGRGIELGRVAWSDGWVRGEPRTLDGLYRVGDGRRRGWFVSWGASRAPTHEQETLGVLGSTGKY